MEMKENPPWKTSLLEMQGLRVHSRVKKKLRNLKIFSFTHNKLIPNRAICKRRSNRFLGF
jgi:hypothetical protein